MSDADRIKYFNELPGLSDPTNVLNFVNFDTKKKNTFAKIDQNVTVLGNGQTDINVYYALNSYTFQFNFPDGNYYLDDYSNYIYTNDLSVDQNNNTSLKTYSLTAKYGQDISAVWPVVSGEGSTDYYYNRRNGNYIFTDDGHFSGWDGGANNVLWVTKRVALTQDMLTKAPKGAKGDGAVINMTPEFLSYGNYYTSQTHYYLQSVVQKSTGTNKLHDGKYYDLLTNYEDNFIMSGTTLSSKQIPGTPVVANQAAIEGVWQSDGSELFEMYYDRANYNLSFDAQMPDGSVSNNSSTETLFGAPIDKDSFQTPTLAGYVFDGWYIDANGTEPFTQNGQQEFSTMPARDVTLFGKWTAADYHIHYYADYNDMINGKELTSLVQVYALNGAVKTPANYNSSTIDPDRGRFLSWNYMVGSSAVALKDGFLITRDYDVFGSYDAVHFNIAYADQTDSNHKLPVVDPGKYGLGTTIRLADEPSNWSSNTDEVFLGWTYTTKDGTVRNFLPGDFVKIDHNLVNVSAASADQTLVFTENFATKESTISVTFVPNDPNNKTLASQTSPAKQNDTIPAKTQSSFNVFDLPLLGWSLDKMTTKSGSKPSFAAIKTDTKDFSVYGHWLTMTLTGNKVYDGDATDKNATYALKLFDVSDDAATGEQSFQINTPTTLTASDFTRVAGENVLPQDQSYALTLNQSGLDKIIAANPDYDFSNVNLSTLAGGTFTISPKPVTVTPSKVSDLVYGQATPTEISSPTVEANSGIKYGDTDVYTFSNTYNVNGVNPVGQYTISVVAGSNPNYIMTAGTPATFNVTPESVIATTNIQSRAYNGTTISADTSYQPTITFGANSSSTVATILPKPLVLSSADYDYVRNNANGTTTSVAATDAKDAGTYTWTINQHGLTTINAWLAKNAQGNATQFANYVLNNPTPSGTYTISPKAVTIALQPKTVVFDGTAHQIDMPDTTTATGVAGEKVIIALDNESRTAVGQNTVTGKATDDAINTNYTVTVKDTTLTITGYPVNVVPVNGERLYNAKSVADDHSSVNNNDFTKIKLSSTGNYKTTLPDLDSLNAATDFDYTDTTGKTVQASDVKNAGTYNWTVNDTGLVKLYKALGSATGVATDANFTIDPSLLKGTYTIDKVNKTVSLDADAINESYGNAAKTVTPTTAELATGIGDEHVAVTLTNNKSNNSWT